MKARKILYQMSLDQNPKYAGKCSKKKKRFGPVLYGLPVSRVFSGKKRHYRSKKEGTLKKFGVE